MHNKKDLASFYCRWMICEQALISALPSSPRFVSAGGLFEDRWLGYTLATFPWQDKCQLLGAFRSDTVGAAWSTRPKEEAFKGHMGDLGAERGHWTAGLGLAENGVRARVSGAGRFRCCLMRNITTGKSSRFGMHIWTSDLAHLPCFSQKPSSGARSRNSAPKAAP